MRKGLYLELPLPPGHVHPFAPAPNSSQMTFPFIRYDALDEPRAPRAGGLGTLGPSGGIVDQFDKEG